jgi:hypothetical protein
MADEEYITDDELRRRLAAIVRVARNANGSLAHTERLAILIEDSIVSEFRRMRARLINVDLEIIQSGKAIKEIHGQTLTQAIARLKKDRLEWRIASVNGRPKPIGKDYCATRVNLHLEGYEPGKSNGKVIKATRG